jgi:5,10-methylenetetrahydromethanopterin reductase
MRDRSAVDLVVYGTEAPAGLLECADLAEAAGLGGVWVGDSPVLWRELYTLLGAIAARTERVRIGPAVTNPVSRQIAVTASALMTLQELSGGRAALGLGLGASALRTVGAKPARLSELEEAVRTIRRLWAGREDGLRYGEEQLPIPLLLGASGPRMLELAGRTADGCLAVVGLHPRQLDAARERVDAGGAGRDFELVFWVPYAVSDDSAEAREDVKSYVARSLRHPLPAEPTPLERETAERVKAAYSFGEHLSPGAGHAKLVPDEIVEDWAVAGTPAECREQLDRIDLRPGERIGLIPMGRDPKPLQVGRLLDEVLWP